MIKAGVVLADPPFEWCADPACLMSRSLCWHINGADPVVQWVARVEVANA